MACLITPDPADADYQGLDAIFEYTNDDGELCRRNCGQAAAATLLTSHGAWQPMPEQASFRMGHLEMHFPPDNLGGLWGTSRRCLERICRAHQLRLITVEGEAALRRALERRNPVAVMIGVSPRKFCGIPLPGGHWLVVYGYDRHGVHVTNWVGGSITWPEFRQRWATWLGLLIGMRRRGLAIARNDKE